RGEAGLVSLSFRPHRSPRQKVFAREEALILQMRRSRRLGIKRLRNELIREHGLKLALATIHKVLVRHGENRLEKPTFRRKGRKRYSRPVPGDRVQVDVCKIRGGIYQYTAIDDCSRWQVAGIFPRKTAASTVAFLTKVRAAMPFPIQRIQTDRGQEFFAYQVQDKLRDWKIKFRPTRPRSPHLNGKVERVQRTALDEFWAIADLNDSEVADRFADWQLFYNTNRPHSSLGGKTPSERLEQLQHAIPPLEAIQAAYDPKREWDRPQHYRWDPGPPKPR
ncbi:MAG: transposase, partial [Proteobacteria bacterium]|nr:transposase [Pseudomonadota bacterium]